MENGNFAPSDRAMMECLKEMLSGQAHSATSIPSPREEVVEFVVEVVCHYFPNFHINIGVISRPEIDIQATLEPLTLRPVSLHDESGQKKDIVDYINSDRRMWRWREDWLLLKKLSSNGL